LPGCFFLLTTKVEKRFGLDDRSSTAGGSSARFRRRGLFVVKKREKGFACELLLLLLSIDGCPRGGENEFLFLFLHVITTPCGSLSRRHLFISRVCKKTKDAPSY